MHRVIHHFLKFYGFLAGYRFLPKILYTSLHVYNLLDFSNKMDAKGNGKLFVLVNKKYISFNNMKYIYIYIFLISPLEKIHKFPICWFRPSNFYSVLRYNLVFDLSFFCRVPSAAVASSHIFWKCFFHCTVVIASMLIYCMMYNII